MFEAGAVSNRATNPPGWPPDQPEILAALPGPTESSSSDPKNSPTEQLGRFDTTQLCESDGPSWHGLKGPLPS